MENEIKTVEFNVQDFVEKLPKITSNIDEIIAWAKKQTEYDRVAVVTVENLDESKERCTVINKVIESIDKKRKEVKKAYNAPYDVFEKKMKEATAVLSDARANLWNQVIAFEQAEKDEKEQRLKKYYEELIVSGDCMTMKIWEKIFNPAWTNRSKSEKSVKAEIEKIYEQQKADVSAIKALGGDFTVELLRMYLEEDRTLGEIIQANNHLQAMKSSVKPEEKKAGPILAEEDEALFRVEFFVEATRVQLSALKQFFAENKIKYGKIN